MWKEIIATAVWGNIWKLAKLLVIKFGPIVLEAAKQAAIVVLENQANNTTRENRKEIRMIVTARLADEGIQVAADVIELAIDAVMAKLRK